MPSRVTNVVRRIFSSVWHTKSSLLPSQDRDQISASAKSFLLFLSSERNSASRRTQGKIFPCKGSFKRKAGLIFGFEEMFLTFNFEKKHYSEDIEQPPSYLGLPSYLPNPVLAAATQLNTSAVTFNTSILACANGYVIEWDISTLYFEASSLDLIPSK